MEKKLHRIASFTFVMGLTASALVGCGGGGGGGGDAASGANTVSAEGVYRGSVSGSSTSSAFSAIVLEDGQVWALYGNNTGGTLFVRGLVQGQGVSNGTRFTSSVLNDFGSSPPTTGLLDVAYVPGASLNGTLSIGGQSVTLASADSAATSYSYDTPALPASVAGSWTLSSTSGNTLSISVDAAGAFTGTATGGCALSGSIVPRPSGKNVYNVRLSLGGSPCALPNSTGAGIGIFSTPTPGTRQLIIAVVDSSRTFGSAAFGTR